MRVIDLFCGVGGFSKGFEMAGFDIILGIDNWGIACESFVLNHPNSEVLCLDISKINPNKLPDADIIIGGPPCQEFTSLNLKKQPWRGMLNICHFFRIVDKFKPKYYCMENVLGIQKYMPEYLPKFKLKASSYGCETKRYRIFYSNMPKPFPNTVNPNPKRTTVSINNIDKIEPTFYDVDELKFVGGKKDIIQMKANAVPPKLSYAIANALKKKINGKRLLEDFIE